MVDDLNRHQTWPPPLLKKKFDKHISKKNLKNPEKGQLLSDQSLLAIFSDFLLLIFLSNFLFLVTEVAMFDGSLNHSP
jgi:hypothetical protein